jgi:predicted MPP superfamily phosphohydrolase
MSWFDGLTLGGWLTVVVTAFVVRSRPFATFVAVLVGVYSLCAVGMAPSFTRIMPVFAAFHVIVYMNFLGLSRPRMRPFVYRLLVSWPAAFFVGGNLLGLPWAILTAAGLHPWVPWLPYALAAIGVMQSLRTTREELDVVIAGTDGEHAPKLARHPHGSSREERPLRIVQISDPHLGPFMSVARLRSIAERAVAASPDIVVLTGDFLTMESQANPDDLLRALEPFAAMRGRVFACHGNHDHEAPELVSRALAKNGIALLVDSSMEVETEAGLVQIVGMDYAWTDRKAHLARVCAAHPRKPGAMRIVLLHDPGAFKHLPHGEGDLVLSGHTHGGQVGLVSIGLSWTFLRLFGDAMPDHGFWARGTDRLYVHRGTGHYGFPLRLGVPAEESLLRVHRALQ